MDEHNNQEKPKSEKFTKDKKWLTCWLLIALLLLLLLGAGYLWWQLQMCKDSEQKLKNDKQQLQQQVDKLTKADSASTAQAQSSQACNDTPSASMKENIKAALDSQNTAAFSTYTTNPVKYVLAASELGGDFTPDQAATNLEYTHSATGPWDFTLPQATINGYDAGFYTDYFDSNTYVGKAASGMVAAFDFDCNGKIKQIFVAADAGLL
jgi:cytoskeletal protein RodZ